MRRTTLLSTALVAGLAPAVVLLAPPAATGAGETCRGEAATIVGEARKDVVGTEGRDVVVTNRSQKVRTLGGDDLVCITGPDLDRGAMRPVQVDTGPGADVVDGTAAGSWPVDGFLGTGPDRFEGGAGTDTVTAGPSSYDDVADVDDETDVLIGGAGRDNLSGGWKGLVSSDVLDAGEGDDSVRIAGTLSESGSVSGGSGQDYTVLSLAPGGNTVTNALAGDAGELHHGAVTAVRWTGVEHFFLGDPAEGTASTVITGGPGGEYFSVSGTGRTVADLGAGDDALDSRTLLPADSDLDGGPGSDFFATGTEDHALTWDLRGTALEVGDAWTIPATGFEHTFLAAPRIDVTGTEEDNRLSFASCEVTVRGRGGDDILHLGGDSVFEEYQSCAGDTTMVGGSGNDRFSAYGSGTDRLVGGSGNDRFDAKGGRDTVLGGPGRDVASAGPGADRFLGGPGRDRVDGEGGRDRCVAEREKRCER